jgi:hypothetical protein
VRYLHSQHREDEDADPEQQQKLPQADKAVEDGVHEAPEVLVRPEDADRPQDTQQPERLQGLQHRNGTERCETLWNNF